MAPDDDGAELDDVAGVERALIRAEFQACYRRIEVAWSPEDPPSSLSGDCATMDGAWSDMEMHSFEVHKATHHLKESVEANVPPNMSSSSVSNGVCGITSLYLELLALFWKEGGSYRTLISILHGP